MDPGRWEEIRVAFDALVELDATARATRLDSLGASNPELRAAVESLLSADAEVDHRLAELESAFLPGGTPTPDVLGLTGRTVTHFRVLEPLGAGGMGVVYCAEDTRLDRPVALKFLLPHIGLDAFAKARFLREARSAAALDHPNLCTVHEVGESEDGRLFLAMTLYRGETLKNRLAREGSLPIHDALAIARQIAEGLSCAHGAGIVHRDLKPGNVMLLPDGTVKIFDFGLAKVRDQSLTSSNARMGTAAYMAPEQMRGAAVDNRADLWALGVVLYEMLTGTKPFAGEHDVAIAHAILHDEPLLPSRLRSEVPQGIEDLVLTLLSKDSAGRPATAREFLGHLMDVGLDVRSPQGRTWRRWLAQTRILTARRWMVLLGVIAVAGVVAVVAWARGASGPPAPNVQPEIVQLTFNGNARTPALSADGRRLAYSTRQCRADGRCTMDIVVEDMEGAGRATVARGLADVFDIQWTGDERYLLIHGTWPSSTTFEPFSIPSLGGSEPRFVGCCRGVMVGSTDTVVVAEDPGSGSSSWARWVTVTDGVTHDSVLIPRPPGFVRFWVDPLSGSQKFLTLALSSMEVLVHVRDRSGRVFDSLRLHSPSLVNASADGRGLFVWRGSKTIPDPGNPWQWPVDLLRYSLGSDGRFGTRPDTILKGVFMAQMGPWIAPVERHDMLIYPSGSANSELWLLQGNPAFGRIAVRRRLAAATGYLDGKLSPDGRRVGILRAVVIRDRQLKQFSVMNSDSGPELTVGSPQNVATWEWAPTGDKVLLAVREPGDSLAMQVMDISGGATRNLLTVLEGQTGGFVALPGGGLAVVNSYTGLRRIGVPGRGDTTFAVPEDLIGINAISASRDGLTLAIIAVKHNFDTLLVNRFSIIDGHATRVATFVAEPSDDPPAWLPDGSLVVSVIQNQDIIWYRLPAAGGQPIRLKSETWSSANYRWSADGHRVLATVRHELSDVFAVRNFRELLNH